MTLRRNAGARLAVDRLDTHQLHEGAHMAAADSGTFALKHACQFPRSQKRMREVQLVKAAHQRQIGRRHRLRLVVQARAAQIEQFTLTQDRHRTIPRDQRFALGRPNRPSALAKKSRSMVSSPTLACRSRMRRSASSAAGLAFSKTSPACSSSCLRHAPIWLACTPWREESVARVDSPRSASKATRALNFDEWFLRDRFMVSAPFIRHRCRYD